MSTTPSPLTTPIDVRFRGSNVTGAGSEGIVTESLDDEIKRLGRFLREKIPEERWETHSAVDAAIRLLAAHYGVDPAPYYRRQVV